MTTAQRCVYFYRFGSDDCFKIGHTKQEPDKRKRGFATGSPKKLTLYKTIPFEKHIALEKYIHKLLDEKRAERGEYFNVSEFELDNAIETAIRFLSETLASCDEAKKLQRAKPADTVVDATNEMREIYRRLRGLLSERYLMERQIEFLKSKVKLAIGNNSGMKDVAMWKWCDQQRFDIARFKREHEALYKQYEKNSGHRRFLLDGFDLTEE